MTTQPAASSSSTLRRRKRTIIVGAGLAGSLLAVYLSRRGHEVHVFERRPDPRAKGYQGGRSINLALSIRGLDALAGVGLDAPVMAHDAIPLRGRMLHAVSGETAFQPYSADPRDAINSVSRGGLNLSLINAAASEPNVTFHFNHPCTDCDLAAPAATFVTPDGRSVRVEADLIASADGAFSAVRLVMMKTDRYEYSQSYLAHGYKELTIHPAVDLRSRGTMVTDWSSDSASAAIARHSPPHDPRVAPVDPSLFALNPHALHIWPRGGAMMIALPNRDGSFTCTLFWPFEGEHSFAQLASTDRAGVDRFFRDQYASAHRLMPGLSDEYLRNPASSLVTVRSSPWQREGKVVLLGDAAHAIVPFYGQGMNAAFEDVKCLARSLDEHPSDQRSALEHYQALRKPNADAIAQMALDNFIEMRDKVGQPSFLYRKRVEQTLQRALPEEVASQYHLVSFTLTPYAEAYARGQALDRLIDRVVEQVPMHDAPPSNTPTDSPAMTAWRQRVLSAYEIAKSHA